MLTVSKKSKEELDEYLKNHWQPSDVKGRRIVKMNGCKYFQAVIDDQTESMFPELDDHQYQTGLTF